MTKLTTAIATCVLPIGLLAGTGAVFAQYTGPSNQPAATPQAAAAPYTGPSSVPLMTVKQLLETGKDDQRARLTGRIVSHDGGKDYSFADDTGRLQVEISAKRFPPNQPIGADQRVEIAGELDKGFRTTEFEVDSLRLLP